jgi:hypothetical protein
LVLTLGTSLVQNCDATSVSPHNCEGQAGR